MNVAAPGVTSKLKSSQTSGDFCAILHNADLLIVTMSNVIFLKAVARARDILMSGRTM